MAPYPRPPKAGIELEALSSGCSHPARASGIFMLPLERTSTVQRVIQKIFCFLAQYGPSEKGFSRAKERDGDLR